MRYFASTIKYIYKNFIFIFWAALLSGIGFAMTTEVGESKVLIQCFITGNFKAIKDNGLGFKGLFNFFSLLNFEKVWYSIACVFLLALALALIFAYTEKHMRYGRRSVRGIFSRLNDNIVSTIVMVLVFFLLYELWALITSGLIYGITMLLDDYTVPLYIALCVGLVVMVALLVFIMSLFYLWLPCLHLTGFSFYEGLNYSNQLTADKKSKIFCAVFFPCVIGALIAGVLAVLFGNLLDGWVFTGIISLLYSLYVMYIAVSMYVIYFDVSGTERADLKKYYINNDDE